MKGLLKSLRRILTVAGLAVLGSLAAAGAADAITRACPREIAELMGPSLCGLSGYYFDEVRPVDWKACPRCAPEDVSVLCYRDDVTGFPTIFEYSDEWRYIWMLAGAVLGGLFALLQGRQRSPTQESARSLSE